MVSALVERSPGRDGRACRGGRLLSFERTDEYVPYRPGPLSERTFTEFRADDDPSANPLPAVYEILGLAKLRPGGPDPH
jgi:hypothetical protein